MKVMHLTLGYWHPQRDLEGWKQDPDGLDGDLSDENLGGESEEALGQINGTSRNGSASVKGEPKTFRASQGWLYDLQVLE